MRKTLPCKCHRPKEHLSVYSLEMATTLFLLTHEIFADTNCEVQPPMNLKFNTEPLATSLKIEEAQGHSNQ